MKKQLALLAVPFLLMAGVAKAEETTINNDEKVIITITATKTERAAEDVPTSMTVITSEEIEQKKATNVADLLRNVAGITVVNSGGAGKVTSVLVRGSSSGQVLIMIDGVQVNSPTLGDFNLAQLSTANIEKIEILRGPQSSLYGSDAAAGVINIVTKKGTDFNQSFVTVEAGSFNTQRTDASIIGANGKRRYSLGFSTIDTDGISAKKAPAGANYERDGYENTTMTGKFGYDFTEKTSLDLMFYNSTSQNDLDDFGGDTIFYSSEDRNALGSATFNQKINDQYSYNLKYSYVDTESTNINLTTLSSAEILTNIETIDFQNNLNINNGVIIFGGEYEEQSAVNEGSAIDHSVINKGFFAEAQVSGGDNLSLLLSAREDDHEIFGGHGTYGAGFVFDLKETATTVKANYGTGFKAPTLNDLFYDAFGSVGNLDLLPEESKSYDVTIEQKIGNSVQLSATYFNSQYDNLIEWVEFAPFSYTPENLNNAENSGFEFGVKANLNDNLTLSGNYTIQEPKNVDAVIYADGSSKNYLARRSLKSGSASLSGDFGVVDFMVTGRYSGKRYDYNNIYDFVFPWPVIGVTRVDLESYTTVDATVNYNVDDNMTVFVRGTNLSDKEYVEVIDYGTEGKAYYAGVKVSF